MREPGSARRPPRDDLGPAPLQDGHRTQPRTSHMQERGFVPDQAGEVDLVCVRELERAGPLSYTRRSIQEDATKVTGWRERFVGRGHRAYPADEAGGFIREARHLQLRDVEPDRLPPAAALRGSSRCPK